MLAQPSLANQNSIHKQDVGLPGNFYYLKSNDDFDINREESKSKQQMIFSERHDNERQIMSEHGGTDYDINDNHTVVDNKPAAALNDYRSSVVRALSKSEYEENLSEVVDCEIEGFSFKRISRQEKTLIERYKILELLMKKKKMLKQVEENNQNCTECGAEDDEVHKNDCATRLSQVIAERRSNVRHNIQELPGRDPFNIAASDQGSDRTEQRLVAERPGSDVLANARIIKIMQPHSQSQEQESIRTKQAIVSKFSPESAIILKQQSPDVAKSSPAAKNSKSTPAV